MAAAPTFRQRGVKDVAGPRLSAPLMPVHIRTHAMRFEERLAP